ncbi:hypothetical protein [Carboxylicivirga marina]|uniref:DUF4251 domain-containing protein n=1 Tax=Carboxylicivirga marina TaxID=2800988 RepID=A0ABS1HQE4_9BACT|nr:hypothetical protein [Carboxylicivirga marina]MBK3519903.1 hypothetical protein [Carboxylicivirga marina]
MKNKLTIILFLLPTVLFGQIEIKGIKLGSTQKVDVEVTSLVKARYYLNASKLPDGRIYDIFIKPTSMKYGSYSTFDIFKSGINTDRYITFQEFENLKAAFEKKFSLKFSHTEKIETMCGTFIANKNGVTYNIGIIPNFSDPGSYVLVMNVTNNNLKKISENHYEKKHQEKLNDI